MFAICAFTLKQSTSELPCQRRFLHGTPLGQHDHKAKVSNDLFNECHIKWLSLTKYISVGIKNNFLASGRVEHMLYFDLWF